jgi:hypothetical protein
LTFKSYLKKRRTRGQNGFFTILEEMAEHTEKGSETYKGHLLAPSDLESDQRSPMPN